MTETSVRRGRRAQRREEAQRQARRTRLMWGGLGALVAVLLIAGIGWWATRGSDADEQPVASISHEYAGNHIHGLGYDADRDRLLLATHFGLFSLKEGQLYQVGDTRDDHMGFSMHPDDPTILYRSGHPALGGHLGVERSTDGGMNFEQVFEGVDGQAVDFHSMTISSANPDVLYGWFDGQLYRTLDGGDAWEAFVPGGLPAEGMCWGAPCLAADSEQEHRIYAGTPKGLFVSDNAGEDWTLLDDSLGGVAGVGISPHDPDRLVAYSAERGLVGSNDGGDSWEPQNEGLQLAGDVVVFEVVFDRDNPDRLFVATTDDRVYQSTDGGTQWEPVLE